MTYARLSPNVVREIASLVWHDDVIVTPRTVDVNITRIRKKMETFFKANLK